MAYIEDSIDGFDEADLREEKRTRRIRELNDAFRKQPVAGDVVVTSGIAARGAAFVRQALADVSAFDVFTPDNDPYHEHDFGEFKLAGASLFWKIDYYDQAREYGSQDPADAAVTRRVLTVMLAEEY
jgi:Protein of unknown function (DUF3768)